MALEWERTVSEDHELLALAGGNLREEGKQVVGNTLGVFTHDTAGVSTSRVEVAEESTVPLLGLGLVAGLGGVVALSVDHVGDGGLNGELGVAVGVGGTQRAVLGDGDHVREASGVTVNGGGAGEDNVGDIVLDHGAQEVDGAVDVDQVVVQGLLARFTDSLDLLASIPVDLIDLSHLQRSEVDNAVNVGVGLEHLVKGILLSDIELDELGLLAGDQLNALEGLGGGVVQVVSDDNLVTGLEEGKGGERANVARTTVGELVMFCSQWWKNIPSNKN